MTKNYYYSIIAMALTTLLVSCSKEFYQVLTAKSDVVTTQSDKMVYEDNNCIITYNLWAPHGDAGFEFYNKTDRNILVDMKGTFFILNGRANDYYLDRTYIFGKSAQLGLGRSMSKAAGYSGAIYGSWYGYDASATASVSAGQNLTTSIETGASASVEIKEQSLVCIPPKSSKAFHEYQIMGVIYRECGLLLAPKKSEIKHLKYTNANSPIKFTNVINYAIGEDGSPISVNNDFYIADIVNVTAGEFVTDIRIEKDCMGKPYSVSQYKTVYKEQAPNKFYIKYIQNATDSDKY